MTTKKDIERRRTTPFEKVVASVQIGILAACVYAGALLHRIDSKITHDITTTDFVTWQYNTEKLNHDLKWVAADMQAIHRADRVDEDDSIIFSSAKREQ